ncbi:hypothetical protein AB9E26_35380, partial [Rhizobium leguminosarum]
FYTACSTGKFYEKLEETSAVYGLAREIYEHSKFYSRINLYLISERRLSEGFKNVQIDDRRGEIPVAFHIWDISRLHRVRTSRGAKEPSIIDFNEVWGK